MRMEKRNNAAAVAAVAAKDNDIDRRAIEAVDALGIMNPMRLATIELAISHDYKKAARKAGVTPETVREWTQDPDFVMAVGWCIVGLSDNHE